MANEERLIELRVRLERCARDRRDIMERKSLANKEFKEELDIVNEAEEKILSSIDEIKGNKSLSLGLEEEPESN